MKKLVVMMLVASFVAVGSIYARPGTTKDAKTTMAMSDSSKSMSKKKMSMKKKSTSAKKDTTMMKGKKAKAMKKASKED